MLTCRDCGASVGYWRPGTVCPHCGGSHLNRLTEDRVRMELAAIAYLFASTGEPDDAQMRQLQARLKREHERTVTNDAEEQRQGNGEGNQPPQGELFP